MGISTFLIDLSLVFLFTHLGVPEAIAVGLGFFIGVSINFYLSYHYVFKGTTRKQSTGYIFFLSIAALGILVIVPGTLLVKELLGVNLYIARIMVAGNVGMVNFLLNNFLNFKKGLQS